jgi:hypothetical protein
VKNLSFVIAASSVVLAMYGSQFLSLVGGASFIERASDYRPNFDYIPAVLVLDLTGRGLDSTELYGTKAHFDFNQDGFAEPTAWLGDGAGFLVLDKNQNRKVDNASELFGTLTIDGLSDLAQYDKNIDGVLDRKDEMFRRLKVWRDKNQDGIGIAEELVPLSELGIVSISLTGQRVKGVTPQGNNILTYSPYRKEKGETAGVYSVQLNSDPVNRQMKSN